MSKLEELLDELGDFPGAVAAALKEQGIKGRRANSNYCPIANYLKSKGYRNPSVTEDCIDVVEENDAPCVVTECITPDVIVDFISGFDSGLYPDLEERDVPEKPQ